jgi:UDP-N-acetylglucosamine--N-acetylmuramyl-(pentapeptide) pyrophosphoryl-undecaprenol N-acetylglucosamine transferase
MQQPTSSWPGPELVPSAKSPRWEFRQYLCHLPIGNGEQALNAALLVDAGAALLVDDKDLSPEWLRSELIPLLLDRARLLDMARKTEALGIRNADQRMADLVLEAVSA